MAHQCGRMASLLSLLAGVCAISACDGAGPSDSQPVLTKIVAGTGSTCALTHEGLAYCWGHLFDEETASEATCEATTGTRCRTRPDTLAFGMRFRDLKLAANVFGHTICGITTESRGYCWGTLSSGADGGLVIGSVPQPLGAAPLQSIGVASHHFCAIATSGVTQCWGDYSGGARGTGQPLLQYVPADRLPNTVAGGLTFTDLGLGFTSSCGLIGGTAYCWGWEVTVGNTGASLSAAEECGWDIAPVSGRCSHVPIPVAGEHTFTSLAAGQNHACGSTDGGEVYCWGSNESGQLGTQSSTSDGQPVRAAVPEAAQAIAVGSLFTCALGVSGLAYCWGLTDVGQSGSGSSLSPLSVPTPVAGGVRYRGIAAGHTHVCALRVAGGVDCWGSNERGELGTGDLSNSEVPRPVQF
jgi:alpha-tubulin suppressor-like RCC1 family protein